MTVQAEIAFGLGKVHSDLIEITERARELYLGSRKLTERFTFTS